MAYGLYLSSVSMMGMEPEAQNAATWLARNPIEKDGGIGWGLPFAWAAFAKAEPNKADTIYGITTALVVQGLLDAHQRGLEFALAPAIAALDHYKQFSTVTSNGRFFWYSDNPEDAKNVHNVSSMLAGQYHRAGKLLRRTEFTALAAEAVSDLISHTKSSENGHYWSYSDTIERPNDAVHAAYTALGLSAVVGRIEPTSVYYPALQYLRKFFRADGAYEFISHDALTEKQIGAPARPWGLGMLLYAACELGDRQLIDVAIPFASSPNTGKAFYPRQVAHIALGLARLADYYKVTE